MFLPQLKWKSSVGNRSKKSSSSGSLEHLLPSAGRRCYGFHGGLLPFGGRRSRDRVTAAPSTGRQGESNRIFPSDWVGFSSLLFG
ncbi:hypothetical protein CEXT_93271 [Caerostris extrusa]|uniref:Uncharacterized protein n=1 Tax=Caerostris extrusa TaxID=172846 RepID=A0AAV4N2Z3_CAEEX|nr:hypothetical protein CEXT_93271 [Caerostris extrusa]